MSTTVTGQSEARSRVDEVLEGLAPHRVVIPRPDGVRAYLEQHPHGLALLGPIVARARQEFPEPTQLSLEVYVDPETAEQDLKLYVRQPVYEPGLWARLLTVCDPFEEAFAQIPSGWLHVTTDHRPPQ
jgi:hypothetical protein